MLQMPNFHINKYLNRNITREKNRKCDHSGGAKRKESTHRLEATMPCLICTPRTIPEFITLLKKIENMY